MRLSVLTPVAVALASAATANAGPTAYGLCQTDCNTVAEKCYTRAGFTFGTVVAGPDTHPAILGCNDALGTCSKACAAGTLRAPTP